MCCNYEFRTINKPINYMNLCYRNDIRSSQKLTFSIIINLFLRPQFGQSANCLCGFKLAKLQDLHAVDINIFLDKELIQIHLLILQKNIHESIKESVYDINRYSPAQFLFNCVFIYFRFIFIVSDLYTYFPYLY